MYVQKIKIPIRYAPGTCLDTSGVLFYQDGCCMPIGRKITVVPGIRKEKISNVSKDRVTEWIVFQDKDRSYVTSMKVYSRHFLNDGSQSIHSEKYLFTRAIEDLLDDTKMCDCSNGLKSAQMFRLENAIRNNPDLVDEDYKVFYDYDRCAYVDEMVSKLLLTQNPYPILPIVHDLIFKKDVGAEILSDPDDNTFKQDNPIEEAVIDITAPIKSYLASSPLIEREIVGALSPYNTQPKILQMMRNHPNDDRTQFVQFKCPFDKDSMNQNLEASEVLYSSITTFDEFPFDSFCIHYEPNNKPFFVYKVNSYFGTDGSSSVSQSLQAALESLTVWVNEKIRYIEVCKTPTEEIFIDIVSLSGRHLRFYVDIALFDLAAHNLIDQ